MLTVKERQELEKVRIENVKKLLIKLQASNDSDDHYQLMREMESLMKDEVLATAPQLLEEIQKAQELIETRETKSKELVKALEDALESSDDDISKKLKRVEKAKAALDAHIPRLEEHLFEEYEMKTGKVLRRLKVLEKLR